METKNEKNSQKNKRLETSALMMLADAVIINLSYFLALWIRFDCRFSAIPDMYMKAWLYSIPVYTVFSLVVFWYFRFYRSLWRYASYTELRYIFYAVSITNVVYWIFITLVFQRMPVAFYLIGWMLQLAFITGTRYTNRVYMFIQTRRAKSDAENRVMIIGAGRAGRLLLQGINTTREFNDRVCCIIDDNAEAWELFIEGVPIVGGRDSILLNVEKYQINKIYLAIPSASAETKRDILDICKTTDCELKSLPSMYKMVNEGIDATKLRNVSIDDLLGREPIRTDMKEVFDFINGKVVLVTGGGGSIGSELCRQIARHSPKLLIIFDIYENNAYNIQMELRDEHPDLDFVTLIGSVRDSRRIYDVFEKYHPNIVYHAAAHKHVPLMEDSPNEAIKNNVIGTYKTAYAAMVNNCERFVLVSTDKAVNPTNIMGASKRLCEMIVQSFDAKIKAGKADEIPELFTHSGVEVVDPFGEDETFKNVKTEYVAVRFGNVLGSNGSVVPLFKKWIEKGEPVRVTHPDIIRYFMTIPEATSLVLLAGTYAKGGEIFVLDMGSPVKIDDLARNVIRLSGLRPDLDVKIVYTGLRPGEKLYEEKLMAEEGLKKTDNELIHIGCPIPFDNDEFLGQMGDLMRLSYLNREMIRDQVVKMVSTYHPERSGVNATIDDKYKELANQNDSDPKADAADHVAAHGAGSNEAASNAGGADDGNQEEEIIPDEFD